MNLISRIALPFLLLTAAEAPASRLVYNELSLSQLVHASVTIVVVEKAAGFAVIERKEKNGCVSQRWPLRVRRVLKAGPGGIAQGQRVPVIVNPIALRGCGFAKQGLMVSMMVNGYGPQARGQRKDLPQRFVAFLSPSEAGHELAAVNGIEAESRMAEIVALIKR